MNTKNLSTKFLAASLAALISVPQIPVSVSAADLKSVSIAGNTYSYSAEALDGYTQIGNSGVYYALTDGTNFPEIYTEPPILPTKNSTPVM